MEFHEKATIGFFVAIVVTLFALFVLAGAGRATATKIERQERLDACIAAGNPETSCRLWVK